MPNALANLDRVHAMLAKASTLDEVKKIRDMAETARTYAKAAHLGREKQNEAAEIALLAARKAGKILKQLQKTRPQTAAKVAGDSEYRKALKDSGTPERTARYWQKLADVGDFVLKQYFAKVREAEKGEIGAAGLLREAAKLKRRLAGWNDDPEKQKAFFTQFASLDCSLEVINNLLIVPTNLAGRFGAPPFSVFDTKQGYWQERQQGWAALGLNGEAGRGDEHQAVYSKAILDFESSTNTNISAFNPALAETIYQWFAPEGGHILDPFAGGSTRGIVAALRGYMYTGIELRPQQVEENRKQAETITSSTVKVSKNPTWICGDSAHLSSHVCGKQFDLLFTCPPYYDLERYTTTDERDGSRCKTYEDFTAWYENIFRQAIQHLKQDRFVVVVVGEIRNKKGWYRNFVGDTVSCFQRLGLHYYNEIILLDPIGSAPIRAGKPFSQFRKVQKAHQNVLVFWKGNDVKRIPKALGVLKEVKFVMQSKPSTPR